MTIRYRFIAILLLLTCCMALQVQALRPGFNKQEYTELLQISAFQLDTPWKPKVIQLPAHYKMTYRSPVVGLDNRWDLWLRDDRQVAVISIRGTTLNNNSWLENFYCAMIPASGSIRLSAGHQFDYHLSDDPRAAVHVGWTLGLGHLAPTIISQVQQQYREGVRNFIIMGHSQGGAIAFLLNSYLHDLVRKDVLPNDITIKTYCSAGPKPGNLYYAYSYEQMTAGGWACNVINSKDWVPETPFSLQTTRDFNDANPFKGAPGMIRKMGGVKGLALGYMYGRLDRSTKRAERRFRRTLGTTLSKQVKKLLPGYIPPKLFKSMDYVRAGNPIVLKPDSAYLSAHPDNTPNIFIHHMPEAYYQLTTLLADSDF